jgi:DNA-binding transcriptional ArsR family regulator
LAQHIIDETGGSRVGCSLLGRVDVHSRFHTGSGSAPEHSQNDNLDVILLAGHQSCPLANWLHVKARDIAAMASTRQRTKMPDTHTSPDPAPLDAVFHALSDQRRRGMVVRLSSNRVSVKELAASRGMRLAAAVKHLAILEDSGLVTSQKVGRVRTCALRSAAFNDISEWIAGRESAMNAAFDQREQAITKFPTKAGE